MQNKKPIKRQPGRAPVAPPGAALLRVKKPKPKRSIFHRIKLPKGRRAIVWMVGLAYLALLGLVVLAGAVAGVQASNLARLATQTNLNQQSVKEQYDLGLQDLQAGRYEVARQRFEYILGQDPGYPGVPEKLAEVMAVLYATATPTQMPPTITPTPTRDPRPSQDLLAQALALLRQKKWTEALDTLVALRQQDTAYQAARVDGMIFVALRQRGIDKIWKEGNLEPGIYDLALAQRFGPLDAQAVSSRDLARLYLIGSSFWEVDPARAVEYFSQVAAASPGLHDASGYTAAQRYKESLVQYGDALYNSKDWCNAQKQYELALSMGGDATLQDKAKNAALQCSPPSATPGKDTATPTNTQPGPTAPPASTATPTQTQAAPPQETATFTATQAPQPTETPTETVSPTAEPTNTSAPPPPPTETPTPETPQEQPTPEVPTASFQRLPLPL